MSDQRNEWKEEARSAWRDSCSQDNEGVSRIILEASGD